MRGHLYGGQHQEAKPSVLGAASREAAALATPLETHRGLETSINVRETKVRKYALKFILLNTTSVSRGQERLSRLILSYQFYNFIIFEEKSLLCHWNFVRMQNWIHGNGFIYFVNRRKYVNKFEKNILTIF